MKITIENGLKSGVIVKTRVISIVSNPIKVVFVVIVVVVLSKNQVQKFFDPKTINTFMPKSVGFKKNLGKIVGICSSCS